MEPEFRIGEFVIRPGISTISNERASVRVEPKVMDLLVYFARSAGDLVEREQAIQDVWPGTFVTSEVLSNAVWKLRQLLEDAPKKPRYIETIPKKGYRLLLPVEFLEHQSSFQWTNPRLCQAEIHGRPGA